MAQSTDKTLKQLIINQMPRSVYNAKKAAGELDPEQVYIPDTAYDNSLGLTAATPGQIIKVKTVQDGKPTEWEAVNPDYTLTVTVNTQDGVTVTGQTVTVRAGDADGPVYGTAEYNGQPVSFRVPDGFIYYVEVTDNLSAHFKPTTVKGVINGANAAVTLLYNDFSTIQTAPDIQAALDADMDLTGLVGQQITCQRGNDTLSWDVVDYDSVAKVVTLCTHDVLPDNMQFEPEQALMYCEDGLVAGSYTFKWKNTQCYFTLTQAIPAGGQLSATNSAFQTYESTTATTQIESGTVSTETIDGATNLGQTGTGNLNHHDRVNYGSNNFGESGILQWLNSDSPANTPMPRLTKFSRPYVPTKAGFKADLDAEFLACIQDTTWKCNANNAYECPASLGGIAQKGNPYTVTAKFALASEIEVFGEYDGVQDGGTVWGLYVGAEATDRIKYYNNSARRWWLRSPYWNFASDVRGVLTSGVGTSYYAYRSYGVAVACKIAKSKADISYDISLGITSATPGKTIKVKTVQDGKPTEWETADIYEKPTSGIPKSDLEQSVQTSLAKADTAISLGLTAATPGQIIKVKAVQDGKPTEWEAVDMPGGVQPDWNQNDETAPDYVKNRPFYTGNPVETVLVEESTVSFSENRNGKYVGELSSTFSATVGETYKVYWDGAAYECVCVNIRDMLAIGNLSIVDAGSDTGEPFVVGILNGEGIQIATADTSAYHTFSICVFAPEVVKIDPKYIRDMYYTGDPVETVLVEESTVSFAPADGGYTGRLELTFLLTVGETYKVYWDGAAYECTCVTFNNKPVIGNLSIVGAGSDTGEPFIIGIFKAGQIDIATQNTSASHTFSISGFVTEVVKIDAKYLPNTVATKSEVEAAQTTADDAQATANNAWNKANNAQTTASNAKSEALDLAARMFGHTSVVDSAFYHDETLSITSLPACIESIGNSAFNGCKNLALTSLPSGITSIGNGAFDGCTKLALTSLPSGLTSIGFQVFSGCKNLALTSLPSGLTSIDSYAFNGCTKLALTSLPSGITSIGSNAFSGCLKLALTSLPSGLTSIGYSAFLLCTKLALTSLPSGITSIGNGAFQTCTGLTSITFTGKPTTISSSAFAECTNLTTINVPWAEGEVANAPWGATNATINYNYTGA